MTEMEQRLREISILQPLGERFVKGVISPAVYTKPSQVRIGTPSQEEKRARQRIYSQRHRERVKAKRT